MPFAELRCAGMTLMKNTGVGIAIGKDWKVAGIDGNRLLEKMNNPTDKKIKNSVELRIN